MIHSILLVQFTCLTVLSTTSVRVLFGLPLGLGPFASYSVQFFTVIIFWNTCSCHCSLFCCSTNVMSSVPNLCLSQLLTWKSV